MHRKDAVKVRESTRRTSAREFNSASRHKKSSRKRVYGKLSMRLASVRRDLDVLAHTLVRINTLLDILALPAAAMSKRFCEVCGPFYFGVNV